MAQTAGRSSADDPRPGRMDTGADAPLPPTGREVPGRSPTMMRSAGAHSFPGHGQSALRGEGGRRTGRRDSLLVSEVSRRSADALAELFDCYGPLVYRVACGLCGPRLAEDVTADVFRALWYEPQAFDAERGPLGGILALRAVGRAADAIRSAPARPAANTLRGAPNVEEPDAPRGQDGACDAKQIVAELPEPLSQVLSLAYFGEFTYRQVAGLLGLAEDTIKSRISAGIARLGAALAGAEPHRNGDIVAGQPGSSAGAV